MTAEGKDEPNRRVGLGRSRFFSQSRATNFQIPDLDAGLLCSVSTQMDCASVIHSPRIICSFV
jgi:hypothetical protein